MSDTMDICGLKAERGQKLQTYIPVLDSNTKIPITIINGQNDGPTLLITAGIHGGEYPGIAAAIEISQAIEPEVISGCLIIIHPVNIRSFWERSAFVTPDDGKNLNREFPGDVNGTLSQKTAWLLSRHFFPLADFYADLHSGDIHEELYPYVYYPGLPNSEISAKAREVAMVLDMKFMFVQLLQQVPIIMPPFQVSLLSLSNEAEPDYAGVKTLTPIKTIFIISFVNSNFFAAHSNNKNIPLLMSLTLFILKLIRPAVGSPVAVVATK